jgi:hypothetical protein
MRAFVGQGVAFCKVCEQTKPVSEFYKVSPKSGKSWLHSACKVCHNSASRKGFREHPEWVHTIREHKKTKRASFPFSLDSIRTVGWTTEKALEVYNAQHGVCAICKNPPKKTRLALDHNHTTGKPRQFLCVGCNTALGIIENKPKLVDVQDYLKRHEIYAIL